MRLPVNLSAMLLALPLGCSSADEAPPDFPANDDAQPVMRWDHRPEASYWTQTSMRAVMAGPLTGVTPDDIADWCPTYAGNDRESRAMFWVGLLSAVSKHESTWNPAAVGGGGQWYGLMQISPGTAKGYGCSASSGGALKDGAANLACAIRIIGQTVPRDGVVAAGGRGVAADWGPFHNAEKRADIRSWTAQQSYCR